jgi:antitoxin component of RelBE/YafQ-DinJ toxin-antitoxin module
MRADIFQDRKCVHVKLEKETHAAFRARLFRHGISMQEAFDEFAKQVAEGNRSANIIVESLINRKLKEAIEGRVTKTRKRKESLGELDSESIYNLINGTPD